MSCLHCYIAVCVLDIFQLKALNAMVLIEYTVPISWKLCNKSHDAYCTLKLLPLTPTHCPTIYTTT